MSKPKYPKPKMEIATPDRVIKDLKAMNKRYRERITTLEAENKRLKEDDKVLSNENNNLLDTIGEFDDRLKCYEKVCEVCEGLGYPTPMEMDTERCKTCNGTGRVRRVVLPGGFVGTFLKNLGYNNQSVDEILKSGEYERYYGTPKGMKLIYKLTRIPDSTDWELTEVTE